MGDFITLDGIVFGYEKSPAPTLDHISLTIQKGERIAVVGANGSGKSTLVKLINGLLIPQSGKVIVAGYDTAIRSHLQPIRRIVGMVFQNPDNQIVAGTVEEEVAFGLQNYGVPTEEMRKRVQAALEYVGLWSERMRPPDQLSGGQKQRVSIAAALAFSPECLIFDEATSMLDAEGRHSVMTLLARLKGEGTTILSVTHDMDEVVHADRVLLVNKGSLIYDESPAVFFSKDLSSYRLGRPLAAEISALLRNRFHQFSHPLLSVEALLAEWDHWRMTGIVDATE